MSFDAPSRLALRLRSSPILGFALDYYGLCWLLAPVCTVALSDTRRDLPR